MDTFVSEKSAILSLFPHQIYESLLIELRIKYVSSVYIAPTKSKIYNMIRENRISMLVNKIHQNNHTFNENNKQRKTISQKVLA
ncbi:hypothetical protein HZS_6563 [Henneguya salminicola]|nr:hypothetical protein HZS_6563 [Henneguya salminicola]